MGGLHVTACKTSKGLDSGGEIARGRSTNGGCAVGSNSPPPTPQGEMLPTAMAME